MDMLSRRRKKEIFKLGVKYGCKTNSLGTLLHSLVGADMNTQIWWTENEALKPSIGITGQFEWDGADAFQVTTAPCESDPNIVSFIYAHEIGHIVLEHYATLEGSFLYGYYTRREAEADAFAFAYLYVTAETRAPSGVPMKYRDITKAIREAHAGDTGFNWSNETRLEDTTLVKKLWEQERAVQDS